MSRLVALALAAALLSACPRPTEPAPTGPGASDCAACLASGGTWQPEASSCTQDCAIMDISCYRDACPGACSATNCGDCFSSADCATAGCAWQQEAEAMWCTAP